PAILVMVGPLLILDVLVLPAQEDAPRPRRQLGAGPALQNEDDLSTLLVALKGQGQLVSGLASACQRGEVAQPGDRLLLGGLDQVAGLESGLGSGTGDGHLGDAHSFLTVLAEDAD